MGFGRRLAERVAARRSQIVLGLDPDPARLWPEALEAAPLAGTARERAAAAVEAHCAAVLDAVAPACVAVKLQVACFERLGGCGWPALERVRDRARQHELLVIADAKRGDIDVTARAYAQAFLTAVPTPFGAVDGLRVDALTVNPYMGHDSLAPFAAAAREADAGLFVLVRTSNPGARDLEDRRLDDGDAVFERAAALEGALGGGDHARSDDGGDVTPVDDVGAVVGATAPEQLARVRDILPRAPLLLPGIGVQGGRVEDLTPAFAPGPAGGLITASRAIVFAAETSAQTRPAEAARAEAERLREAAWRLA